MSVLPMSLGTSSESAKATLAVIVVWPIFVLTLYMYAGSKILPIPAIGLCSPWYRLSLSRVASLFENSEVSAPESTYG